MAGPFKQRYNKSTFPFKSPDPYKQMERVEKDVSGIMGFGDDDSGETSGGSGGSGRFGFEGTVKTSGHHKEYYGSGEVKHKTKKDRIKSRIERKKKRKTTKKRTEKIEKLEKKLKNL